MLAELRITPVGEGRKFAREVATVAELLRQSPLRYQVHAMGTTVEGDLDEILGFVRTAHRELRPKVGRLLLEIAIDDRDVAEGEISRCVEHLREAVGNVPLQRLDAAP